MNMKDKEMIIKSLQTLVSMGKADGFCQVCGRTAETILEKLNAIKPIQAEIEGGGSSWWWVCPECRMTVGYRSHYCSECGSELEWRSLTKGGVKDDEHKDEHSGTDTAENNA